MLFGAPAMLAQDKSRDAEKYGVREGGASAEQRAIEQKAAKGAKRQKQVLLRGLRVLLFEELRLGGSLALPRIAVPPS